jgi:hypothetical protein
MLVLIPDAIGQIYEVASGRFFISKYITMSLNNGLDCRLALFF